MKKIVTLALASLILTGCTSTLEQVNSDLKKFNESMAGKKQPSQTSSASAKTNTSPIVNREPTEAQKKQISMQINPKATDAQIKAMIVEAAPTVEKVLGMQACFYSSNTYGKYITRGMYFPSLYDFVFSHHDKSQCVNVERVKDWKAITKNALTFSVMYVSEQSGESQEMRYEIQKQLDGVWLFKN